MESNERSVKLILRYDGGAYFGWQRQPDLPTVQARVEAAVERVTGVARPVQASGRTDAGVHALGQVAHLSTPSRLAPSDLQRALNANLPHDIAVVGAEEVASTFHARFSARRKTYFYQFAVSSVRDPFHVRYHLSLPRLPNVDRMRIAARGLVGTHDFRAFATEADRMESTVRELASLRVLHRRGVVRVFATANGFLQHMVRTLAGGLLRVGTGQTEPDALWELLRSGDRRRGPAALPAHGLFLWRVDY